MARSSKKVLKSLSQQELTESEWAVMKVIWQKQPCAAGTVQEGLAGSKNWAYSTVKTTMDRMVNKGLLGTYSIRNLQLFTAKITEEQAQRSQIFKTIKLAFDGALTPMIQFLLEKEKFSEKDLQQLRQLVKKAGKGKGGKK